MEIIKLAWVGTRTDRAEQTVAFFRDLLGLRPAVELDDFWVLKLPDGSKVESSVPTAQSTATSQLGRSLDSWSTTSSAQRRSSDPRESKSS